MVSSVFEEEIRENIVINNKNCLFTPFHKLLIIFITTQKLCKLNETGSCFCSYLFSYIDALIIVRHATIVTNFLCYLLMN